MNRKITIGSFALLSLASLVALTACTKRRAHELDERAVREATGAFYAALNVLFTGDAGPMKDVWSHADDVTYMGPTGGFQVGWDAVLRDWETQAALKLGGSVKSSEMHVVVGRKIAVVSNWEVGENTNAAGGVRQVSIRATNVFRKERGDWKMIAHHTDLLPYLAQ
jgi:ketosteroid isomerase-like protein